MNDILGNV